jgi:hypothetical protein
MTVDELVVELKIDTSGWTKGQKEALEYFSKSEAEIAKLLGNVEQKSKNVSYAFGDTSKAAEGLFTVIAGAGVAAFARDVMNTGAATGRMAQMVGMATEDLSAFGRMIERNGGSAEGAIGSVKSFADQVARLNMFGEGSDDFQLFVGTIGATGMDWIHSYFKFAEFVEKNKLSPQNASVLGEKGGLGPDLISEALKGREQVEKDFAGAKTGAITDAQSAAMRRMQESWVTLDQAIEKTGRDIVTDVEPAFTEFANSTSGWIEKNQKFADSLGKILTALSGLAALKPAAWLLRFLGLGVAIDAPAAAVAAGVAVVGAPALAAGMTLYPSDLGDDDEIDQKTGLPKRHGAADGAAAASPDVTSAGGRDAASVREARIRMWSKMLGLDPDVEMQGSHHEGFDNFKSKIPGEESYGDFQLNMNPGNLGWQFMKDTGKDPRKYENEAAADLYALRYIREHGHHAFHGFAAEGIGDHQGIHIDAINITTDSKDPREHGRLAADAIRNSSIAQDIAGNSYQGLR